MSVDACYRRITAQELAELRSDPGRVDAFFGIFEDIEEEDYEAMTDAFQESLNRLGASGRYLDIMNEHQALNFLLTGQAKGGSPPLGSVVEGGTLLGDIDVGYGPPRFLTPDEVREAAVALAGVTENDIRTRFDPIMMNEAEVYPANRKLIAGSGWRENDREGLVELFLAVKTLFLDAAGGGDAILFWYQ